MAAADLIPLPPQPEGVPWPTERWEQGELDPRVDRARLEDTVEAAMAEPQPATLERTHATLVIHRGRIVHERYADDAGPDDTFDSWSMAKSITQALVGICVREGKLDIHAPAPIPAWQRRDDDPRRKITVDQLLRMVDGLRFREEYVDADNSEVIPMLFGVGKDDVAGYAAELEYEVEPEARWNYNSGASNLLARIVGDAVGGGEAGMRAFMRDELFDPIGMRSAAPRFDAAGTFIGSSFCFATARDFARFGYLYLRDGVWDGRRILPEGWVDYARTPTPQSDQNTYGSHFWMFPGSLGMFYCSGFAGQRTIMSPRLDLLVVRLGNTPLDKLEAVNDYTKQIVDAFRPTLR